MCEGLKMRSKASSYLGSLSTEYKNRIPVFDSRGLAVEMSQQIHIVEI